MSDCYLLNLPFELLLKIVELVTPSARDLEIYSKISSLLHLRLTCRTFRLLVADSPLWHDDDFCFETLSRRTQVSGGPFVVEEFQERAAGFFSVFAADTVLIETIGLKKTWAFQSMITLEAVERHIPEFFDVVASLHLGFYASSDVNRALDRLPRCRNLSELHLQQAHDGIVSLDLIASCSTLVTLWLWGVSKWSGSLEGLRGLQKYSLYTFTVSSGDRLLPLASSTTLESLWINSSVALDELALSDSILRFSRLVSLRIGPLSDNLCISLARADFRLETFHASFSVETRVSEMLLDEVLLSPALADVKHLALLLERRHRAFSGYRSILRTVTTKFAESLEDLTLCIGINTAWCDGLGNLEQLRRIKWISAAEDVVDSRDPTEVPNVAGKRDVERLEKMVAENLMSVFESRQEMVEVVVWILNDADYGINWELDL